MGQAQHDNGARSQQPAMQLAPPAQAAGPPQPHKPLKWKRMARKQLQAAGKPLKLKRLIALLLAQQPATGIATKAALRAKLQCSSQFVVLSEDHIALRMQD